MKTQLQISACLLYVRLIHAITNMSFNEQHRAKFPARLVRKGLAVIQQSLFFCSTHFCRPSGISGPGQGFKRPATSIHSRIQHLVSRIQHPASQYPVPSIQNPYSIIVLTEASASSLYFSPYNFTFFRFKIMCEPAGCCTLSSTFSPSSTSRAIPAA